MVRPNQVIRSSTDSLTFIMFAQSKDQVIRRVLALNFPGKMVPKILTGKDLSEYIDNVTLATKGRVNRYQVTVDLNAIQNA